LSKLKPKLRNRIYYATGTIAGQRIRQSLETSDKARAEELCAIHEARLWKRHSYGEAAVRTFEEAAMSYMEAGGERRFLKPLLVHFRGRSIAAIGSGDIRTAAAALYPTASPATWNRQVITPARAVLNHAHDLDWRPPLRVRQFKTVKPPRIAIGEDWVTAFETTAGIRHKPHLAALARFMFDTGARISEALRLTWADIDFNARTAVLQKTKNGEPRNVVLTDRLFIAIANLPRHDPVFLYANRHSIYGVWQATCRAANIPYVPPHQAGRHSFATMINRLGVDAASAMEAGGWKDARLYLKTYVHVGDAARHVAGLIDGSRNSTIGADMAQAKTGKPLSH
jgi:integrase